MCSRRLRARSCYARDASRVEIGRLLQDTQRQARYANFAKRESQLQDRVLMPDLIHFDTSDLERVTAILHRRAAFMVRDIVNEGRHHADEYWVNIGGRHRKDPGRYTYLRRAGRRVRARRTHATGNQIVRMIE